MKISKFYLSVMVMLPVIGLVGCGGGSDSDGSRSGSRTIGVVDAVNGNESLTVSSKTFGTSNASVSGDDVGSIGEMVPGMVVTVRSNGDMEADEVDYDAEVEGVVSANNVSGMSGELTVMGQTVIVSDQTQFVSKIEGIDTIEAIPVDSVVEVSGFADGSGNIMATFIKLEDDVADEDDEMEVEGIVENLNTVDMTFDINGFTIQYDENTEGSDVLENGINVEVEIYMNADGMLIAEEIEIEHDEMEGDEGDEIEIEGVVTSPLINGMFDVNGQTVKLADMVEYEGGTELDIVVDAIIEVEGTLDESGMLIVTEVEFEHGEDESSEEGVVVP